MFCIKLDFIPVNYCFYMIINLCWQRDALLLEASNVARCVSKGKSEPFECRNHIRVLQPLGDGERLYVCGTNAHSPKDWVVYVSSYYIIHYDLPIVTVIINVKLNFTSLILT